MNKEDKELATYQKAIIKFNNGNGALLCNNCSVIIAIGFDHEDREHYCPMCMSAKCTTKTLIDS